MQDVMEGGNESVFRNRQFLFIWLASTFTGLAFSIYLLTESWYVVQGLNMESWLGIVMMMTTIPRVLLMTVGGVVADRFKRSHILFIVNAIRGVFILWLFFIMMSGNLSIWFLIVFALGFGILDAFFWPSSNAIVPQLVKKNQLTRANSIMQTSNHFSFILGPAIAGVLLKFSSFQGAFLTSSILLLISAVLVINMKVNAVNPVKEDNDSSSFINEFKEGFNYVKGFPFLLAIMATSVVVNFFLVGPVTMGLPIIVKNSLSGSALDLSFLESSLALGMVVGAILTGIVNFKRKRPVISLGVIGFLGGLMALLSQITSVWQGVVIISLAGLCLAVSNILMPTLIQEFVDEKMMGRVQSIMATASMGFTPLSYAFVSILLSVGVNITFIMLISCTVLTLFVGVVLWKVKIIWSIDR